MLAAHQGDEYHDLAVARQQAASIMVSGTSSSMEMNDVIAPKMSFNECGTECIELAVSFEDSTMISVDPACTTETNQQEVVSPPSSSTSSVADKVTQLESSKKRHGGAGRDGTDAAAGGQTTTELPSIQPLAPDVAKEYYNVITTSAMMGNVPRLFTSDAANNYYHAMLTRNLLNDDSFKSRAAAGTKTNKANWVFGRKKNQEGEEEKETPLIGEEAGTNKPNTDNDSAVQAADADKAADGTNTDDSAHSDAASSTKPAGTFKKLITDKLFVTKSTDSYERLNDGGDKNSDVKNIEEVTVETVTSSGCDSSDSTVLSGNSSSNSLRYSTINNVGDVVTVTIDGNTNTNGEKIVMNVVNEREDDSIERSRSPASGSGNSFEDNIQGHDDEDDDDNNKSIENSEDVAATTTSTMTLDELLRHAVAASTTPEDVARYILDYEIDVDSSGDHSKDGRQKLADDHELLEMLLVEAVVASTTPEDVARFLLEHDWNVASQTDLAVNDQPKEVIVTSETSAEIISTEFPKNEIPETRSWGKKTNSLSKKLRSVRSMSPSLFKKKEIVTEAKGDEVLGLNNDNTSTSSDNKCGDNLDLQLKIAHSTESNNSKSVKSSDVHATDSSATPIDENSLSKKLRSVGSMSPSLFKKKEIVTEAKGDEVLGLNNDNTSTSSDDKCVDNLDLQLKIAHSTESNNSKSVKSSDGHATDSSATPIDELLSGPKPNTLGNTSGKLAEMEEVVAPATTESSVDVFKKDLPAGGFSQSMSWSHKSNGVSNKLRSVRSMSPSIVDHNIQISSVPKHTDTIAPIPSSPNDTSPVFVSSSGPTREFEEIGSQRECVDSSAISKCVSFDKQAAEKDDVKRSKTMQFLALPPLPPRPQKTKTTDVQQPKAHHIFATTSDDDGSVECSFVAEDVMTLKSAPSCGECSIKTEYVSTSSNCNDEGQQLSRKIECATVPTTSDTETSVTQNDGERAEKVPTVESGIDVAQDAIIEEQKSKTTTNEINPNGMPDKNKVSISSLMTASKNNEKDATATIATCNKTQETAASTVDENEYAVLYGPVLIDTTPKFCVDPKAMAEEFISDLKSVQSSVKNMFASLTTRKGSNIATVGMSCNEESKKDDSKDDESVISWSQFLVSK